MLPALIPLHRATPARYELSGMEAQFARHSKDFQGGQRIFLGLQLSMCPEAFLANNLPKALVYAQIAHPVLQCVPVLSPNGLVMLEHQPTKRIPISKCQGEWEAEFSKRANVPLALGELPLRVFYAVKPNDSVDVVFQCEHYCMDGACGPELVHSIIGWTTGVLEPPTLPCTMPLALEDASEASCLELYGLLRTRLNTVVAYAEIIKNAIGIESESLRIQDTSQKDSEMGAKNTTLFKVHRFDEDFTVRFVAKCKAIGASVTAVITAVFCEAHARVISNHIDKDEFQVSVSTVASVRKACVPPTPDTVCSPHLGVCNTFFTGKIYGKKHADDQDVVKRIADVARRDTEHIKSMTTQERLLFSAKTMAWRLSKQPIARSPPTMVVSSWSPKGPVFPVYDTVKVDGCLFAMNAAINAWTSLGIYTIAGKLHVHFMLPTPRFYKEDFDRIVALGRELIELVERS